MIAAQYTQGAGTFAVRDVPVPTIDQEQMLLRIEAASICGTDLKIIRHGHRKLPAGRTITLGHEFAGTIETVGERVVGFERGQRVGVAPNMGRPGSETVARGMANMDPAYTAFGITFDGSHAEYLRIPAEAIAQGNVIRLPDGMPAERATLAEPLSCAINAVRQTRIELGDSVAVVGCGPMGLLNLMLAKVSGAGQLIAVDLNEERLDLARRLGATQTIHNDPCDLNESIRRLTDGRGVDVVICAVPVPQLQQQLLNMLAPFGRLCLFAGWPHGASSCELDTNPIHYRALTVTGTTGGSNRDYAAALHLIASGAIDVSRIVSHVLHISRLDEAYRIAQNSHGMKIVLTADASREQELS